MNRKASKPHRALGALAVMVGGVLIAPSGWRARSLPAWLDSALAPATGVRWFAEDEGLLNADWIDHDDWVDRGASRPLPADLVLLVHGLDEPGGIWDALAPAIHEAGYPVARFDYPNDQPVADSAAVMHEALVRLRAAGVRRIAVVAHSMGGLVTRDVLTRTAWQPQPTPTTPAIPLLITLGTPHAGSPWARWQPIAEAREQIQRWAESPDRDPSLLFGWNADGLGEAAIDLRPGSPFLTDLNSRPRPPETRIVCVVAILPELPEDAPMDAIPGYARALGDGVVPAESAVLEGADRVARVRANHRSMVRPVEIGAFIRETLGVAPSPTPPAIPIVLEELDTLFGPSQTHP